MPSLISTIRDTDISHATPVSERRFSAPFAGDRDMYVHERDYVQDAAKFRPLELSAPDSPDYPASFLVEEKPPQVIMPGVLKWARVFARIPASRIDGESFAWSVPGIAVENIYQLKSVDNASSFNISGTLTKLVTTTDHDLQVGHFVQITFNSQTGDVQQTQVVYRAVAAVAGLRTIHVPLVLDNQDPYYIWVQRVDGGRDPTVRVVPSRLQFDYFMPGIPGQPKTFNDITIFQPPVIRDGTGKETDTYATTTTPDRSDYLADVAAGNWLVAEASSVRRWRGNIFERVTRFVRTQ